MQMASQMVDIYTTGLQKSPVWKLFFRTEHTRLLYSRRNVIPMPFAAWMGQRVVWVTMAMTTQRVGVLFSFLILQIQRHLGGNTYELCTFKWICSLNRSKQIDGACS